MATIPRDVQRAFPRLKEDYATSEKKSFEHFFCPILLKDEATELCMGHVIPESYPNCCRAKVVQRADVDNWYGAMIEADYGTFLLVQGAGLDAALSPKLGRRIKPRVEVEGRVCRHYLYRKGQQSSVLSFTHLGGKRGHPERAIISSWPKVLMRSSRHGVASGGWSWSTSAQSRRSSRLSSRRT